MLCTVAKGDPPMPIIRYRINDVIEMKKQHPCGCRLLRILRVGSEMRVLCTGCGRDMTLDRIKLEKATKRIVFSEGNETDNQAQ